MFHAANDVEKQLLMKASLKPECHDGLVAWICALWLSVKNGTGLHYRWRSIDLRKVKLSVLDEMFWTIKGSGVWFVFGHVLTYPQLPYFRSLSQSTAPPFR
jgi:hypothetical protein